METSNPSAPNPAEPANAPANEENPDQYLASYNELRVKEAFVTCGIREGGVLAGNARAAASAEAPAALMVPGQVSVELTLSFTLSHCLCSL